jgi:hypothetical protein
MDQSTQTKSLRQRWEAARPTKTGMLWACVASAVLTMILGFTWGGWVMGSTARTMAEAAGGTAVVTRLAPICVVQFKQDAKNGVKLKELKDANVWDRSDYVKKQGWATMPGEQEADTQVASECAKLIVPNGQ